MFNCFNIKNRSRQILRQSSGQVMLLTAIVLTGTLLSASTIAGILMIYQLRQASDISESSKAILAADTGLEWELYRQKDPAYPAPVMTNGASFETEATTTLIKSIGHSGRVSRALQLTY